MRKTTPAAALAALALALTAAPAAAAPADHGTHARAFIAGAAGPARLSAAVDGVPASVTIAQAILESGWGRSGLTVLYHNFFGMKCHGGQPGPIAVGCVNWRTWECRPVCAPAVAPFRVYATIEDSFRDHGRHLREKSRYARAFAYSHDAEQFAREIHKAGYATDPAYSDKLINLMRRYDLARFDR